MTEVINSDEQEQAKFTYNDKKSIQLISNNLINDVTSIVGDYLKPNTIVTWLVDWNNIFHVSDIVRTNKFTIMKIISFSSDGIKPDGLSFGFVDDSFNSKKKYANFISDENDMINIQDLFDENLGYMKKRDKKIQPNSIGVPDNKNIISDSKQNILNFVFHISAVNYMNKFTSEEFGKYNDLVKSFEEQYKINPKMLLYVKTFKNGLLESGTRVPRTTRVSEFHSENDLPAITWANGKKEWYKNGKLRRDNAPAVTFESQRTEFQFWFQNGKLSRIDGPAIRHVYKGSDTLTETISDREWWVNGLRHREGDEPASLNDDMESGLDLTTWWKYGMKHRDDGPARIEIRNTQEFNIETESWYQLDRLHRIDGPAVTETMDDHEEEENSYKTESWYYKGLRHRDDGFAIVSVPSGDWRDDRYFFHGTEVKNLKFLKKLVDKEKLKSKSKP